MQAGGQDWWLKMDFKVEKSPSQAQRFVFKSIYILVTYSHVCITHTQPERSTTLAVHLSIYHRSEFYNS